MPVVVVLAFIFLTVHKETNGLSIL